MQNVPEDKPSLKSQLPGIIIALATAGTTFWLLVNEYWPISMLNNVQATVFFGWYSEKLSFIITWLLLLLPFVLIKFAIKKLKGKA
jgi:hypothetical protein